jgi:ABC-type uncharacterized transport system substrate-binding protein
MVFRCLAVLMFGLCLSAPVAAHPHVWVDVRAEIAVAAGYVEGVWVNWTFDEAFSQLILADFPPDGSGKIDAKGSVAIKKGYFDNLKTYRYFSHLGLGAKTLEVPTPQKFVATLGADGRIGYRFFLPLGLRLDAKTPLAVSFYDETFFTDMVFEKKAPVTVATTDGGKAGFTLKTDPSKTYYGGQVTPTFAYVQWAPQ